MHSIGKTEDKEVKLHERLLSKSKEYFTLLKFTTRERAKESGNIKYFKDLALETSNAGVKELYKNKKEQRRIGKKFEAQYRRMIDRVFAVPRRVRVVVMPVAPTTAADVSAAPNASPPQTRLLP